MVMITLVVDLNELTLDEPAATCARNGRSGSDQVALVVIIAQEASPDLVVAGDKPVAVVALEAVGVEAHLVDTHEISGDILMASMALSR